MKSKSPDDPLDIDALVTAANQHVERAADRQHPRTRSALASAPWVKITLLAGALVFLFMQGLELRQQLFGATQAAVALQAQSVLTAAQAAVELHRKETGELPDRVPLAALDALVAMESDGTSYRLKLVLDDKTWNLDQQGKITEEQR